MAKLYGDILRKISWPRPYEMLLQFVPFYWWVIIVQLFCNLHMRENEDLSDCLGLFMLSVIPTTVSRKTYNLCSNSKCMWQTKLGFSHNGELLIRNETMIISIIKKSYQWVSIQNQLVSNMWAMMMGTNSFN